MTADPYIPSARDATIGFFGGNARGACRTRCVACSEDVEPLTDPRRVYGGKPGEVGEDECDLCGAFFEALSALCQWEHDEQQARWARESRVDHVIEMGCVSMVRCRVY